LRAANCRRAQSAKQGNDKSARCPGDDSQALNPRPATNTLSAGRWPHLLPDAIPHALPPATRIKSHDLSRPRSGRTQRQPPNSCRLQPNGTVGFTRTRIVNAPMAEPSQIRT
jgi:hypothetical protein